MHLLIMSGGACLVVPLCSFSNFPFFSAKREGRAQPTLLRKRKREGAPSLLCSGPSYQHHQSLPSPFFTTISASNQSLFVCCTVAPTMYYFYILRFFSFLLSFTRMWLYGPWRVSPAYYHSAKSTVVLYVVGVRG